MRIPGSLMRIPEGPRNEDHGEAECGDRLQPPEACGTGGGKGQALRQLDDDGLGLLFGGWARFGSGSARAARRRGHCFRLRELLPGDPGELRVDEDEFGADRPQVEADALRPGKKPPRAPGELRVDEDELGADELVRWGRPGAFGASDGGFGRPS